MTVRDAQRAIAPGSVEHGNRQALEAGLSDVLGQSGGGGPAPAASAPPALQIPSDPLGALLSGDLQGDSLPVTDGLSVGPGAGPPQNSVMLSSRAEKLRMLASEAASPHIRASARNELRRMARQAV